MFGGRTCPETIQQSLCMETDCDLLQWSISEVLTFYFLIVTTQCSLFLTDCKVIKISVVGDFPDNDEHDLHNLGGKVNLNAFLKFQWSECEPNYGMPCGRGVMTRLVDCVAGDKCEAHQSKPLTYMDCDKPCLGDRIVYATQHSKLVKLVHL